MLRYLRLYGAFLRFAFGRAVQFRLDFFFRVLMDVLWYAQYLFFFDVLYAHTQTIGGWTREQGFVFTGALFVVDALQMTVFANNLWAIPTLINGGDLDYHLVRPVSSLFMASLRDFAVNSFLNLLMAIGVLIYALVSYSQPLPPERLAVFGVLLLAGLLVHYVLHILSVIPVFWTQSPSGFRELFWTIDPAMARPVDVYRGWVRRVLTTVLPLGIIVSFPCRALFEGPSVPLVAHMLGVTAIGLAIVVVLWRRGLRAYASASS
jgi:ABC-2 type transport system permease protein